MNTMTIEQAKDILIDNLSDDEIITAYNEYFESVNDIVFDKFGNILNNNILEG